MIMQNIYALPYQNNACMKYVNCNNVVKNFKKAPYYICNNIYRLRKVQ